jgi:ketosteroid isomerase-like protein
MLRFLLLILCSTGFLSASPESNSQKEVLAAMDAWKQAILQRDKAGLDTLYAPGLVYSHSSGKRENKAEAIETAVNGKERIESIDITDPSVSVYGKTAMVQCKITMILNNEGKATTLKLDILHVWVKTGSRWQMAARHAARLNP